MLHRFEHFKEALSYQIPNGNRKAEEIIRDIEEYFNSKGIEVQRSEITGGQFIDFELPKGLRMEIGVQHDPVDFLLFNDDEIVCDWTVHLNKVLKEFQDFVPIED